MTYTIETLGTCTRRKSTSQEDMKNCINGLTANAHESSKNYLYQAAYHDGSPGDPVSKQHIAMLIESYALPKLKDARIAVTDDAKTKYLNPGPHKITADSSLF